MTSVEAEAADAVRRIPVAGYEFIGGLTAGELAFRDSFLAWLDEHLAGEFAEVAGVGGPADDEAWDIRVAWDKELARGGWRGLGWPTLYGGQDASPGEQLVFELEYVRANAPYRPSTQSEQLFGATLLRFGTEAQKQTFLPPILTGDTYWAQGFSEPDAGSDLAGVRTRATLDGDRWVIDGQKIWTTFGHYSQWMYVLCRTNGDQPKHKGLSFLLVPLDQPGIEIRPIKTLAANADFSEVYFSGAVTDASLVVGEVDHGWAVAMGLLGIERGATLFAHQLGFERELDQVIALAREQGRIGDAVIRQRLAQRWIELRLLQLRNSGMARQLVNGGELGQEVSLSKVAAAVWHQQLGELQMSLLGASAGLLPDGYARLDGPHKTFLLSRAETIYGGSSEIQRNIIAERLLGLPR